MDSAIEIAAQVTRGDRQRDYAHPLLNMVRIAVRQSFTHRFELKDGIAINPYKAVYAMVDLKFARQEATGKQDNIIDAIGYTDMVDRMAHKLMEWQYVDTYTDAIAYFDGWTIVKLVEFLYEIERLFANEQP